MLIYGINPILEALRAGRVSELRVSERGGSRLTDVVKAAGEAGVPVRRVSLSELDRVTRGGVHQGAVADITTRAGASLEGSLRLIERIGAERPDLPLVPMGYANQVIGGGDGETVMRRLANAGAAGVIVADLTPDEGGAFEAVARDVGMAVVYLVAPTTPPERRARVAVRSGGFLYCVSLIGLTGARSALAPEVRDLVADVRSVSPVPVAVGFGISSPEHVAAITKADADGVVVASALVDALGDDGRDVEAARTLAVALREATAR